MAARGITLRELDAHPVSELRAVGARLEERLATIGIESVLDLLEHYPRRYHDRRNRAEIASVEVGEEVTVDAEVRRIRSRPMRARGRTMVEADVYDGTGLLHVVFFNQPYRERQLPVGTEASFFGRVDVFRGRRQMTNPVVDVLGSGDDRTGVLMPVYPASGKAELTSWQIGSIVRAALERTRERGFADPLPSSFLRKRSLVDRTTAYHGIHRPDTLGDARRAARRLKFDEFLRMQVGLVARKRALEREERGIAHVVDGELVDRFLAGLPFEPTSDQRRAIAEIRADLARPVPMHRLLQGEVGSGKTVVALTALLMAVQGGYQGAFMSPTEVLAEQHHFTVSALMKEDLSVPEHGSLLGARPVNVALLTNRTSAGDRRRLAAGLLAGEVDIVIGTHALIYEGVTFARLGLAVIDEQHRFGVEQRDLLRAKGARRVARTPDATGAGGAGEGSDAPADVLPDVLVMTATPIPRTAAFLVYGDLDKSELRDFPASRIPVVTEVAGPAPLERARVYERLRAEVADGRQAYVVCPLVEGSARTEARAAAEEYERLGNEELAGLRLGLLHGQMPSAEKEAVMAAFRGGDVDVLVATTVIEVGVDVPNATVMVVEDADRFGLLQLHQLRGRVGRGSHASWCFLLGDPTTPEGSARLAAMVRSSDGFELAERDLEIRGAGEVFGERQSGFSDLKLGRVPRDEAIVLDARAAAEQILDSDPDLERHGQLREEVEDLLGDDVEFLFKS